MPILRRNPLAFPAGARPGFNPSHPASVGISSTHGFSGIARTGPGFISLLTSKAGAVNPTPTFGIDGAIGPACAFTVAANFNFTGLSTANDLSFTFGIICRIVTLVSSQALFTTGSGFGGGQAIYMNASNQFSSYNNNGGTCTSAIALVTAVPYFLALSGNTSTAVNWIIKRLDNGAVRTVAGAAMSAATSASNGTYMVGNDSGTAANAQIAAVMFGPSMISGSALRQWADDPWSFWYPSAMG